MLKKLLFTGLLLGCSMAILLNSTGWAQYRYDFSTLRYTNPPVTLQPTQSVQVNPVVQPVPHSGQYGGVTYFGPAYTPPAQSGQYGSVTYFGAPPVTNPTHSGQYGGVTYLGGARPYSVGGQGSHGSVTIIAPRGCTPTVQGVYGSYGGYSRINCR